MLSVMGIVLQQAAQQRVSLQHVSIKQSNRGLQVPGWAFPHKHHALTVPDRLLKGHEFDVRMPISSLFGPSVTLTSRREQLTTAGGVNWRTLAA